MYAFISGKIVSAKDGQIVIENNGIGYLLTVSGNTLAKAGIVGATLQLHTYLQVKEDLLALFGFATIEEKQFFLNLISISGIGPKLAMQVLSGYDLNTLAAAIATGDVGTLSKIKGLGKKTAERIVLELRDSYNKGEADVLLKSNIENGVNNDIADAVFALVQLGVTKTEAVKAIKSASEKVSGVEKLISYALRNM
ncbi:MAG TPA: Holliday junction branch migration protein RuvA [Clostridia bacterium]|nr:Holliday junction branch migration protein RuvA [Clostridia bacterium]